VLTRGVATILFVGALVAPTSPAWAGTSPPPGPPPVQVTGDNKGGYVSTVVQAPGAPTDDPAPSTSSTSADDTAVRCTWTENSKHLEDEYLHWIGWGEPGGRWYDIRCTDGSMYFSIYVPPAANNVAPGLVLANALAQRAANRLPLPAPTIRYNPSGAALVNLATWLWVDPRQWRSITQRTAAGPVWARVTARPVKTVWDPGDGSPTLTCRGGGTPYDSSNPADGQTTDCSHTYTRSSADQPQSGPDPNDRFFTVTVTVYWQISFTGNGGAGGALPAMTRTTQFPLRVEEREAVVTSGSG
jgi:hypothetical protein